MSNPTIVAASLDDKELRASIDSLVEDYKTKLGEMVTETNNVVTEIKNALGGKTTSDTSKTKSATKDTQELTAAKKQQASEEKEVAQAAEQSATRVVAAKKREKKATEETTMTLDQQAAAVQKAAQSASSGDFLAHIKAQNAELQRWLNFPHSQGYGNAIINSIVKDFENLSPRLKQEIQRARAEIQASLSLPFKGGAFGVIDRKRLEAEIAEYQAALSRIGSSQTSAAQSQTAELQKQLQLVQAIASKKDATRAFEQITLMPANSMEEIQAKGQALVALVEKVKDTPLMSQTNVRLAEKMIGKLAGQYQALKFAKEQAAQAATTTPSAENATKKALEDQQQRLEQLKAREAERREQIIKTGLVAQEQARKYRESIGQQMETADYTKQVDGVKELQIALNQMKSAFKEPLDSAIKRELEQDIALTQKALDIAKRYNMAVAGLGAVGVGGKAPTDTLNAYAAEAQRLVGIYRNLTTEERKAAAGQGLVRKYQELGRKASIVRKELERPINLKEAMGGAENSIDAITHKIQRLQSYKRGLNIADPKQAAELRQVDIEINRLNSDLDKYERTTQRAQKGNNTLTRSWTYMKNRLAFYLTVGAGTQFVQNLIDVRAQYEMTERSLGILVQSAEKGSQIFQELSSMALVSPYTLLELSAAAKQLTAYDIAAKDVVDTTRRLADMASAVGVPMERLTYALGQIKAYGYLNSRDARMFLNAGIPLVKNLADHYSRLKGEVVSVGEVYDMIKKKAVGFEEVMSVITEMTDEGGRFFDFQAKMAGTLKVELANLTLAWNNMLNAIGESNQGFITAGIRGLKEFFLNWRTALKILTDIGVAFGAVKIAQIMLNLALGKGTAAALRQANALGTVSVEEYKNILSSRQLTQEQIRLIASLYSGNKVLLQAIEELNLLTAAEIRAAAGAKGLAASIGTSMGAMRGGLASGVTGLLGKGTLITVGIFAAMDLVQEWLNRGEIANAMLETLTAHAKESSESISTYFETYGEISAENMSLAEATKAWDTMREEIETASAAANVYLADLMKVDNIGDRLSLGNTYLKQIRDVRENMSLWDSSAISVAQDFKVLGIGMDGLATNTGEYLKTLREASAEDKELVKNMSGFEKTMHSVAQGTKEFAENLAVGLSWLPDNVADKLSFDESRFKSQVADVANDLMAEFERQRIFDPLQIFEGTEAWLRAYQEQSGATEAQIQAIRIQLFNEYRTKFTEGIDGMDDYQKRKWGEMTSENLASWEAFLKLAKQRHGSAFEGIREEEIRTGAWLTEERKKYLDETLEALKETNYLAYKDVVDKVNDLNRMKVLIPVIFQTYASAPLKDALEEAGIDPSLTFGAETLTQNVSNWKTAQKAAAEEGEKLRKARAKGMQGLDALIQKQDELDKTYTDALHTVGALTDAEEKAAQQKKKSTHGTRAQREAESELQKTLNNELKIIDKVRARYKELSAAGYDRTTAIQKATEGFTKSQNEINKVFAKWGLEALDLSKLAGATNPREIFNVLQEQLNKLIASGKVKPVEIQSLETKVGDLRLDVDKFDAKTIVESLDNAFSKIKDEYELAIAFDESPELGSIFSSLMGLDEDYMRTLPRTMSDVAMRMQAAIAKALTDSPFKVAEKDVFNIFSGERLEDWAEKVGITKDSDIYKQIDQMYSYYLDTVRKTLSDVEKEYDNLVRQRGDVSDKLEEIESRRLRRIRELEGTYDISSLSATERGGEVTRVDNAAYLQHLRAINNDAAREEANALYEAFKNMNLYIKMFEDLGFASEATLTRMKAELDSLRTSLKGLSPQNLKEIVKQMQAIDDELIRRKPFKGIVGDFKNYVAAMMRLSEEQERYVDANDALMMSEEVLVNLKKQRAKAEENGNSEEIALLDKEIAEQERLVKLLKEENDEAEKNLTITEHQIKTFAKKAQVAWNSISANIASLSSLRDYMKEMGAEVGDWLNGAIDGLNEFNEGVNQVISSLKNMDVVGALTGVVKTVHGLVDSVISIFGGGSAKEYRINRELKKSERQVKRLLCAYLDLQHIMEDTYGAAESGARRVALANKELELQEIQRQIRLEKSRSNKKRDEDRILELEQQYKELAREIKTSTDEIVNDILGNDRANFAENLVSSMIDAFKQGEDYMQVFEDSFEEMVDHMIMKAIVSRVVAKYINAIWDGLDERIELRSAAAKEAFQEAEKRAVKVENKTDNDVRKEIARERKATSPSKYRTWQDALASVTDEDIAAYRKASKDERELRREEYERAATMTKDDIEWVKSQIGQIKSPLAQQISDMLEGFYDYGQSSTKDLSQLQQGIQSMTETTANALEAYWNANTQQQYVQSDLLTQIRDAVVAQDADVQMATMGQILLQLQASYNVHMSIRNTLDGWSAANGMAVRVQMV